MKPAFFVLLFVVMMVTLGQASAQEASPPASQQRQQPQLLDNAQLDQLVAPIALYSDPLLAQVLMASTYPLEVVQADCWAKANKSLKGDKLTAAVEKQDWDASVKQLVSTPTVLAMMNDKLDWTQALGDAVLAQQADVMDAIQRLRAKAQANGKLDTTKQQKVTVKQDQGSAPIIEIEPASPDVVYVPYYEPAVVYGDWPYPAYPPYYFPPPSGWVVGGAIATGIAWGAAYAIGREIWAYVQAQNEYAALDPAGLGRGVYAQRIVSRPGKKDGLYWPTPDGEPQSPLGDLAAQATAEGYNAGEKPIPFHGYYYRILTRQGADAPGGAYDYLVKGKLKGGFALIAVPAEYGNSGIMTFMVNQDGTVFQKDLGPNTTKLAAKINAFVPDLGWTQVD